MTITIRALSPDDWPILRAFWLAGLADFPVFFGGYDGAATAPAQMWKNALQGPRHQMFGLFDDASLIGITAAFSQHEDPQGQTAIFGMSFIAPEFRGRGLSRLLYEARLEWIRAHPEFRRVILSHRASNQESRRAHRRYGFVLTGRVMQTGPDGKTEPEEIYEMALSGA